MLTKQVPARGYASAFQSSPPTSTFQTPKQADVSCTFLTLGLDCTKDSTQELELTAQGNYCVTLIPGDGIGPEIAESVKQIFSAAKVSSLI